MLHLDGSTLEGGGQLVRNALALSALTGKSIKISKIRNNRKGSTGLKASHTAAVNFLAQVCGGTLVNAYVGSSQLTFYPEGSQPEVDVRPKKQKKGKAASKSSTANGTTEKDVEGLQDSLEDLHISPALPVAPPAKPEYNIRLQTPGSIFLIFQAIYPYLLYSGAFTDTGSPDDSAARIIKVKITGGTNVSFSPSYDYVSQVLIPNFAKLGLPKLSVSLSERGWCTGKIRLGTVSFEIEPLSTKPVVAEESKDGLQEPDKGDIGSEQAEESKSIPGVSPSPPCFPFMNLASHDPGRITQIDITILAPDFPIDEPMTHGKPPGYSAKGLSKQRHRSSKDLDHPPWEPEIDEPTADDSSHQDQIYDDEEGPDAPSSSQTIREVLEEYVFRSVSRAFGANCSPQPTPTIDGSTSSSEELAPLVKIHTSERTHHITHIYVLLTAHTSTGFRLGGEALGLHSINTDGAPIDRHKRSKGKSKSRGKSGNSNKSSPSGVPDDIHDRLQNMVDRCLAGLLAETENGRARRCLDVYMRDQVVVFQALGKLTENTDATCRPLDEKDEELSLHTQTAIWVCDQVLGVRV
ncbi:hypothetical protein AJ80_08042 [Polytolypa hystricis UAMH7299]|uniref:RNA 3'-terminal phosphate cyclase domain-containing protein n=1 Tax=Polytolypa hystricis (strain UAMH7299) TaxID=1447883 RepID=A0A2B7XDP1_POLH7|nr:hypothetical protein AJ80_08042 [Polytolypa hystricis UAMH7299]